MQAPRTGWPPGLLQDDDRKLSRWLAGRPHARGIAREVAESYDAPMPRKPPDPKRIARRNREIQVAEDHPLPKVEGSIKDLEVLNTDAVILDGVFDLAQLEAVVAYMRALRES